MLYNVSWPSPAKLHYQAASASYSLRRRIACTDDPSDVAFYALDVREIKISKRTHFRTTLKLHLHSSFEAIGVTTEKLKEAKDYIIYANLQCAR